MGYSLTSDRYDLTFLRNLALYTLLHRLARLPWVAQVRINGVDVPSIAAGRKPWPPMA